MKKMLCSILAVLLLISSFPGAAFAATENCYEPYSKNAELIEVVKDKAPIRSGPGEENAVIARCMKGTVVEVIDTKINVHLNKWYKIVYRDADSNVCYKGYIYSKNTTEHSCNYESLNYDGVVYKYCDCGRIIVTVKTGTARVLSAEAIAATAGGLAVLDGPIPVGEIIGVAIMAGTGLMMATGAIPSTGAVTDVLEDIDFDEYLRKNKNECSILSYRKVQRVNGLLEYVDDDCMNAIQAYVYVLSGKDVYCKTWDSAMALASMHPGGCFSEVDANQPGYYYHFHLGQKDEATGKHKNVVGGHIFYGTSIDGTLIPT